MIEENQIKIVKETTEEFFEKMTILTSSIEVSVSSVENKDVVDLNIEISEPQILIGQGGQTLLEIQRLLKTILNKKLQNIFYLNLDINGYKNKKVEYLKYLADDLANQVALSKEEKSFAPMSAYERRIIHAQLSERSDVTTESQGDAFDRHIVIKPK
jgi:spoIIIJ-associated protein